MYFEPSFMVKNFHRPNIPQPDPSPSIITNLEINRKEFHLTITQEKVNTITILKQAHLISQVQ
jgi:hypothetical protein